MPKVIDILVILTFMDLVSLGFFHGMARLLGGLIAVYGGTIFAAWFYRAVADAVRSLIPEVTRATVELAAFLVLFFGFAIVVSVAATRTMGQMSLPRRLRILDTLGGIALGVIVAALSVIVAVMFLTFSFQVMDRLSYGGSSPFLRWLQDSIDGSVLVPMFLDMAPFFTRTISPWIPGDLPPALRQVG